MTNLKFLPLLLLVSCGGAPKTPPYFTPTCDVEPMAKFIIDCAEAANPRSDEEGEDLVEECKSTGISMYCGPTCFKTIDGHITCRAEVGKETDG